jgi:FAD/FMN-containing dehydrogenase
MSKAEATTGSSVVELDSAQLASTRIDAAAVQRFVEQLRGELLTPESAAYDAARQVWNGMIDRRPALIVRCAGAGDVAATVKFARAHDLPISVRGGGHNVAGGAIVERGVVIDLSGINYVRVDPERRVARVGGGARLGDVDRETQAFGLAAPLGLVSRTGVAGLTLHGGLGAMTRSRGLSVDSLIGADVVTADGRLLVVDEQSHPDLLWALRGGGGNFGAVTAFEFRLYPVGPDVSVALVLYPAADGPQVLRFLRDTMPRAADEVMAIAIFWNAPDGEPVPQEHRGAPIIALAAWHTGPLAEAERQLQPFREVATPIADLSSRMPYVVAQSLFDHDYPDGRRYYWKSAHLEALTDDAIEALARHAATRPSPLSTVEVWALGGAFGRVPADATAFGRRDAPFLFAVESNWDEPGDDAVNLQWAREAYADVQRFTTGSAYLNFPGFGEEEDLVRRAYGANYERLQAIKMQYDPDNLFRSNLNIRPR